MPLCSCGEDAAAPNGPTPIAVERRVPVRISWQETGSVPAADRPAAIGSDRDGRTLAAIGGQTYLVDAAVLTDRPAIADENAPTAVGEALRIRPRSAGGAWVAADSGLWFVDDLFVRHRPTGFVPSRILDVDEVDSGPLAGLWLAASDGVYWAQDTTLQRLLSDHPPERIAVRSDSAAFISQGAVRILRSETDGLFFTDAPFTSARDVVAAGDALYVATDEGVYFHRNDAWTQIDVGETSATALAASGNDIWVRTSGGIIRLHDDVATRYPLLGERGLAVDRLGDVYAMNADGLDRGRSGIIADEVVTFAANVRPWIDQHCAACHSNQTQDFRVYDVFREVANDALSRVRSGDMPRCLGGVRCPSEQTMSSEDYEVLEQWIRAGLPQ